MTEKTALEKYLAGEPLNEELAAIRRGEPELPDLEAAVNGWVRPAATGDDDRPLTKDERLVLREARQLGAVTTFSKLLRKCLQNKIRQATIDSENDPLGRQSEIAQTWAYVLAFRRAGLEMELMIQNEIEELEKDERGQHQ